MEPRLRILVVGWFSFRDGEATAGDVLALKRVEDVLARRGAPYDVVWSPVFRERALHFERVRPEDYSHLIFVCGPLHGPRIEELHRRFAHCVRIAVGTSVIDPASPAVTGFHRVLARDARDEEPVVDLSARAPATPVRPVVGVILTHGQHEYGRQRRHAEVAEAVTRWLSAKQCARLELDTRLDAHDWRLCSTPSQLTSVLARLDLVVTDRLHGLVLSLRAGTPALAVDPVAGGAKVTAQARACGWPAVVPAEALTAGGPNGHGPGSGGLDAGGLERWWHWCLTAGRREAHRLRAEFREGAVRDSAAGLWQALESASPAPAHEAHEVG
ncbi:polysaccharide pyruvyl transferase family protein [Streptomyces sp. NPDC006610]|uniref:polysaccharide pyruvyl transferase family protein n=1 Tax=Streptomyces sp. NPDC006610 TaxID=3154584 RepID=UPI0033A59349